MSAWTYCWTNSQVAGYLEHHDAHVMSQFFKNDVHGLTVAWMYEHDINGLVQDCSNSSALAMELLQSCTDPSMYGSICNKEIHFTHP